jgi:hypothetical protein
LNDLAALGAFDAVVVGAPEALNASDVSGLEAFLRRRGGSVVFLFDRQAKGAYEQLTRVARWSADSSGKAASITATGIDTATLRAAEMAWPTRLAGGAEPLALANANRPVVWRASVGAGQIVVSGAFDSWRFRDASVSGFDHFWRSIIADAANSAPPPVDVRVENAVLAPGRATNVTVTLRDIALASGNMQSLHASVSAKLESDSQNTSSLIRLWPDRKPGEFRGQLRVDVPGTYRLVVAGGGSRVETPIVVSPRAAHPAPSNEDVLTAWTAAHGGHVIPASQLARLPAALNDALQVPTRLETWHPMRSAWWLVPFVLALSAEWWMRRRRGLN